MSQLWNIKNQIAAILIGNDVRTEDVPAITQQIAQAVELWRFGRNNLEEDSMETGLIYLTQEQGSSDDVGAGVSNESRVWSLWDIMNVFDMGAMSWCLREVTHVEMQCLIRKLGGKGSQKVEDVIASTAASVLTLGGAFVKASNLPCAAKGFENAKHQYERPLQDHSSVCEIFHRLFVDMIDDLKDREFLRVNSDRSGLIDVDNLFGAEVAAAFPSAYRDIKEAGNCLAAECPTAAVFHLMRAAEVALRAVAIDRSIVFAKKPLDQQEWGAILISLDTELRERVGEARSLWLKPEYREAQTRFYAEMINELRGFNEAWRKHVAHAGLDAFCDREYAKSVMTHVRNFMQKAAARIGETKATPKYWDTE